MWTKLPNITESQCLMPCNITGRVSTNKVKSLLYSLEQRFESEYRAAAIFFLFGFVKISK